MRCHLFTGLSLLCLATPSILHAQVLKPAEPVHNQAVKDAQGVKDAQVVSARIDQFIAAGWKDKGAAPAKPADDAEFLRRVYLDVAGRIPTVSEARAFLEDKSPDKRALLLERLLDSPQYVNHFTNTWRALLLPQANNQRFLDPGFTAWLSKQFRDNERFDRMVASLLIAPVAFNNRNPRQQPFNQFGQSSPLAFYQANEQKPENLAASTSRIFMGVKLECAQCHDHPFAKYTRKQFWELAAFFAGIRGQGQNGFFTAVEDRAEQHEIKIPGTEKLVKARFLDGTEPQWKKEANSRATLADWLTSSANPYFARNAVNRTWAHFFGIGIIEPVDEPGDEHPASHPELLDELSQQFVSHQFDMKFLIRSIVLSKTYQLSSAAPDGKAAEPQAFARMAVKGLTPEQLFDSLVLATGFREQAQPNQRAFFQQQGGTRGEFLTKFAAQEKRTEFETSILQALTLMNGKFVGDATDGANLENTQMLASVVDFPLFDTHAKRIEALYLATLSRQPRAEELDRLVKYVESGGAKKNEKTALADVFWALLNSTEFILNH